MIKKNFKKIETKNENGSYSNVFPQKNIITSNTSTINSNNSSCLEEEKTIIPFEKGVAIFRHLRISKNIKLKKAETITISNLGFEIGYHNPFTKIPFKSLDIFLSKPVKIHIVAHKGSVKIMQKHGLLPTINDSKKFYLMIIL